MVRNTKSTTNNLDYKLCKGDIIKMGRIKFNVKQVQMSSNEASDSLVELEDSLNFYPAKESEIDDLDLKNIDVASAC